MIFVTVGSRSYQFDRLFKKLDELYEDGTLTEEMFAQIGMSSYIPKHFTYKKFITQEEFVTKINKSSIVVSHGASGSIMKALNAGKKVIVVTRLEKYKEHINDHQSGVTWRVFNIGINLLLHVTGSIMAFMVLQTLANQINWQDNKLFKILSSYSMPMYLFHQQFIYFAIIALNGVVAPWINATLNFIVAFMGSFLISAVLMQWNCTRVLIGENKMQIIRKTAE